MEDPAGIAVVRGVSLWALKGSGGRRRPTWVHGTSTWYGRRARRCRKSSPSGKWSHADGGGWMRRGGQAGLWLLLTTTA